jgi:hypothetical protein
MWRNAGFRGVDLLQTLCANKSCLKAIFAGTETIMFAVVNAAEILPRQQLLPC